jgi:hypothetical protein
VKVILTLAQGGQPLERTLLSDTGAGSQNSGFDLILDEDDCLLCGGNPLYHLVLTGAYAGSFPVYGLRVRLPALGLDQNMRSVGVPSVPAGFHGIGCFGFLNRFTYGNFGDPKQFGLEN